jgi:nitrogen-specific signal transduction histidine kinase
VADNRRQRAAQLEQLIIEQQQKIARLVERLAYYENGGGLERQRAEPRIY